MFSQQPINEDVSTTSRRRSIRSAVSQEGNELPWQELIDAHN